MDYSCTQESGRSSSSQTARRRTWSRREESVLIDILKDMVIEGWKADNGFRQGYNFEIEKRLKLKIPDCTLQAEPHISSKIHVWMKNYRSVALIKGTSGFGWSELTKTFSCDDKVWAQWVKVDPNAKILRNKSFPYINEWAEIFGKDRATGENSQSFQDAANDVPEHVMQDQQDSDNEDVPSHQNQSHGSPGLRMGSTSCTESRSGNRAGKKVNGSKRTGDSPFEERFLDIMQSFSQNTKESLNGIACRLGFEHETEKKRNSVFDSLSNMHFLSKEDKMVITMRLCKNQQELSMFFSLSMEDKAIMGMDNMDVDGDGPHFFKAVQFRTLHTMAFLPATHHHYRGVVLPQQCNIETIEGRKYEATLDMVNNCPTLTDGWRDFILAEDITINYFLVFRPRTIFDFEVWVMEPNGCERLPHYTFSLQIYPTHVERARLLKFGDRWYDVDIIHGHGKKLLQNGHARQFIDDNIVVGDVCKFFLLPHDEVIKFKVKM
ncbi:retrotransposon protein [Striga asiatica]|uniref:Retrotransposon protein n=1 Tax=Striga asiatica TaxID=4170 RepID=A0A5A7NZ37_STRAF|nr:retrotransposon protein [Striga asiatica]